MRAATHQFIDTRKSCRRLKQCRENELPFLFPACTGIPCLEFFERPLRVTSGRDDIRSVDLSGVYRQQDYSVSEAKKVISDYRKTVGRLEGIAELTVFYCEEAFDLFDVYAVEDEGHFTALVRMFEQAMRRVIAMPEHERMQFIKRLTQLRTPGQEIG
jgi:hypothetical protein